VRTLGYIILALCCVPSLLVCADLFWFGARCPEGGRHTFEPHPATYLSGSWVQCANCGMEDY
jgi:hypothetical protein